MVFAREMSDAPPSAFGNYERSYQAPQEKPSRSSIYSLVRQNPLISATIFCTFLIFGTVAIVSRFYNAGGVSAVDIIQRGYNQSGVSFSFGLTVAVSRV